MEHTPGDPLDVSYHKGQYIRFRGGDLKGFCDKRSFIKRGWGMPHGDHKSVSLDGSYPMEQYMF